MENQNRAEGQTWRVDINAEGVVKKIVDKDPESFMKYSWGP